LSLGLASDSLQVLEDIELKAVDTAETMRALLGQARAAKTLRDWGKIQQVAHRWRGAFSRQGQLPPTHSTIELLEFEAHYNCPSTHGALPDSISECLKSPAASLTHKLSAASLAMIRADNDGDALVAGQVFECVLPLRPETSSERVAWLTTSVVYHAAFGDLKRTPELLHALATEGLSISQPALRAHHIRRAGFGLARYGDPLFARQLLMQSLETFDRLCLAKQSTLCVEELGLLALYSGEFDETLHWIAKAHSLEVQTADPLCRAVEYELRVLLAFETNDDRFLPTFQLPEEVAAAFSRSKRGRQAVLSVETAHRLFQPRGTEFDSAVAELLDLHWALQARGYQDQAVQVLGAAIHSQGEQQRATQLVADYVNIARREIRPVPLRLQELVDVRATSAARVSTAASA
jgi:hypothetical protein